MSDAPALRIRTREELVSLLYEAAELEHGLLCSYLFTAFTLKRGADDGVPERHAAALERWRGTIMSVALEEMVHLALVCNLLTAVGAAPHLRRPPFPQVSRYYPAGITIELRRFDDRTMTRFMHLERPDDVEVEPEAATDPAVSADVDAPDAAPGALRTPDDPVEEVPGEAYETVGHLYEAIEDGVGVLVERLGEAGTFIGPSHAQATAEAFSLADLVAVRDLRSAREALTVLVTQGEGVRGDWTDAHYGRFLRIRDELRAMRADDPGFDPAQPVLANPVAAEPPGGAPDRLVDDAGTVTVMQLFDGCYELMTAMLLRFFAHSDESDGALEALVGAATTLMTSAIAPLGARLTTLPAGPSHPGATAGPAFDLYRPVSLIPHRRAAWLVFHERLVELAAFARRLAADGGPGAVADDVAAVLAATAHSLEPHLERAPLATT